MVKWKLQYIVDPLNVYNFVYVRWFDERIERVKSFLL